MKANLKKKQISDTSHFGAIRISLSSPEKIRELSYGEVKKTETLNYKSLKPERDGLFCEKIFGPVRDFECSCGRYKKSLTTVSSVTKKLVCDRCGVEITVSSVRRERMGHINLVVPVAHYWYFGKSPSKIALILDMMQEEVRDIIYGISWVVVEKLENIQDVVIKVVEKIKNECLEMIGVKDKVYKEDIEKFWDKIIEGVRLTKVSFERKFVLSPKNIIRNLEEHANDYEFMKILKNEISQKSVRFNLLCNIFNKMINKKIDDEKKLYEGIIEVLAYKLIDAITDDERYVGNLSNNKNYLYAKVLTNAEAIWRLLRDEDLEKTLREIKEELGKISEEENIMRIKNLLNVYLSDNKKFQDDINKIEAIVKHLKDQELLKLFKDENPINNVHFITKFSDELVKSYKNNKIPLEALEILYELFSKYNIEKTTQIAARSKLITRFRIIESFLSNGIKPEWMVLQVLPVLPPDLRPLVPIEGGKFASSDLNELYRRVIHRNNRLKKFCGSDDKGERKELFAGTPKLIILNEKRLLQEAVDALIENSAKKHPILNSQKRPLKSLTDILKGKQGRFRQNLLGKRVDYSGRSVIVVGPELKLYQCGIPKEMALELFKPYLLYKIMKKYNVTLRKAKLIIEKRTPEVWDILEEIIKHHPVLLNRAPTLHRPSIEAFEPVLIEGKAIKIHPMVCAPFNADFDGDQMAVYVPLTLEALAEARLLIMSYHNLFSPANGKPLIGPTQDIVLGVSYLTSIKRGEKGEGFIFSSPQEALYAYTQGYINLNAKIKVYGITEIKEENLKDPSKWESYTSVGRIIFNEILPEELRFKNCVVGKKELFNIVQECYKKCGSYRTVVFLDDLKKLGYHYATVCGFTISVDDMLIPEGKSKYIEETWKKVKEVEKQAKEGIITEKERYNSIIDIWSETIEKITAQMIQQMKKQDEESYSPNSPRFNSVYFMAESGARGNMDQVKQLSAIRGLMSRPQRKISGEVGEIIETPVLSNFREGLSVLEYFISTHGGRKGLSDTALKTSEAGYLTRRLIDVAHHVIVVEEDCGTINRIKVSALKVGDEIIESLKERIVGRVAAENISYDVIDEETGKVVTKTIKAGEMITQQQAEEIEKLEVLESIPIRSVLTCESKDGVCAKCYGMDLSTGELVKVGESVGIIAAQSIGEPGTQLTLRTFHIGGAASTLVKKTSIRSPFEGKVEYRVGRTSLEGKKFEVIKKQEGDRKMYIVISSDAIIRISGKNSKQDWQLPYGSRIYVEDGEYVSKDQLIADWDAYSIPVIATKEGNVEYSGLEEGKTFVIEHRASGIKEIRVLPYRGRLTPKLNIVDEKKKILASYNLPADSIILVENGEKVKLGDVIAKIPREEIKTKDITAGLPRVEELFEARRPQNAAILSEISGTVRIKSISEKDKEDTGIIINVVNEKTKHSFEYKIPPGRFHLVHDGDTVEAGEPLTDGTIDPHKYLAIRGAQHLQEFLLNEIQGVYRLQGVSINDKHIEIIIRQMLSFVRIVDPGIPPKTDKSKRFYEFIYGEIVPKKFFVEEIKKYEEIIKDLKKQKKHDEIKNIRLPKAEPILLGITAVASASESFLSAASFQETSRVLTQAAIECRVDYLTGLKENVIIGHLIPCGTGFYEEEAAALRKEEKLTEKLLEV